MAEDLLRLYYLLRRDTASSSPLSVTELEVRRRQHLFERSEEADGGSLQAQFRLIKPQFRPYYGSIQALFNLYYDSIQALLRLNSSSIEY